MGQYSINVAEYPWMENYQKKKHFFLNYCQLTIGLKTHHKYATEVNVNLKLISQSVTNCYTSTFINARIPCWTTNSKFVGKVTSNLYCVKCFIKLPISILASLSSFFNIIASWLHSHQPQTVATKTKIYRYVYYHV